MGEGGREREGERERVGVRGREGERDSGGRKEGRKERALNSKCNKKEGSECGRQAERHRREEHVLQLLPIPLSLPAPI